MRNIIRVVVVVTAGSGTLPAPATAASAGPVIGEIGGAVLFEGAAAIFGYQIIRTGHPSPSGPGPENYDTLVSINPYGIAIGAVLFAAYPLAAAAGTHLLGEGLDGPSAEKGTTFGRTTFFAYGQTLALAFGAGIVGMAEGVDTSEAFRWAFWADVSTKPLVTAYVYNRVKKPASPADSRLAVEPYVCTTTASDGRAVPMYGVTVSF